MEHVLRAEYEDGSGGEVRIWHVVRQDETAAMCGRELADDAATRSAEEWGSSGLPLCHSCGALYLREVP
ncbi:hypothetical protein [Streptomyces sp. ISL-11]|uniref:hypothetical protein n=1 Tax=Streptomyces sp. ISL-11 TaxID=2819174 RepID=UPI001BE626C7|nr:hypothetical protein [Streptomyces sp. ISL-11]MBT2384590.1 hypothetical protein [Streptomyces sp. ISL-11]